MGKKLQAESHELLALVEARGIEPLSEINISKTSTSVAFDLILLEKSSKADFISN